MSDLAIQVHDVGKLYRIGRLQGYLTFREAVMSTMRQPLGWLGKNARRGREDTFWALRNVGFEIQRGEVVGVVGRNGAGKSTLLKILSRITEPTEGQADVYGRVGSLLEVGTGFHPELSGRENIYLNGAILGMKRAEIQRKFDEIVAFAEIEQFLDTPVKRFSSGMYMRLAFAVAANLEPEVLLVDEVLAVGDAVFQKKCLGKMNEVARAGRTVMFVSHQMAAVAALCTRCIWLERGQVRMVGPAQEVLRLYQASGMPEDDGGDLSKLPRERNLPPVFRTIAIEPVPVHGQSQSQLVPGGDLTLTLELLAPRRILEANVMAIIYDSNGYRLADLASATQGTFLALEAGQSASVRFDLHNLRLKPGTYNVGLWLGRSGLETFDQLELASRFEIHHDPSDTRHSEVFPGPYLCEFDASISPGRVSIASLPAGA